MKRLLFLKATDDYSPDVVAHMKMICELLEVEFVEYRFTSLEDFETFGHSEASFDFLYLGAHGSHECFGEKSPPYTRWADFGLKICETQILNPQSVVLLGCCKGGLKRIAIILFSICPQIRSVCGPRWSINQYHSALGLHVFLHNHIIEKEEPERSAKRTEVATGKSFPHYSRYDHEAELVLITGYVPDDYKTTAEIEDVYVHNEDSEPQET